MVNTKVVASIVTLLVALYIAYLQKNGKFTQKFNKQPITSTSTMIVPVRKDGVIFVSDGAKGSIRQASIELAKHGYHVLVGCKTDAEIRSFAYDTRKGLELIKFDIADPATFVTLIYRLRQIRRDLDRPIVGIVLNLAGKIFFIVIETKHDHIFVVISYSVLILYCCYLIYDIDYIEDYANEVSTDYLNIISMDRHYKALFKGPVRLLQVNILYYSTLYSTVH